MLETGNMLKRQKEVPGVKFMDEHPKSIQKGFSGRNEDINKQPDLSISAMMKRIVPDVREWKKTTPYGTYVTEEELKKGNDKRKTTSSPEPKSSETMEIQESICQGRIWTRTING